MTQLQDLFQGRLEDWWRGVVCLTSDACSRETASGDSAFPCAWVMRDAHLAQSRFLHPVRMRWSSLWPTMHSLLAMSQRQDSTAVLVRLWSMTPPVAETIEAGLYHRRAPTSS